VLWSTVAGAAIADDITVINSENVAFPNYLVNVTVGIVYICRWICVFMAVEVFLLTGTGLHAAGLPQTGVQAQKTSKMQLKFTLSMHNIHVTAHTAFMAEIYEHRLLKCVFLRFFSAN